VSSGTLGYGHAGRMFQAGFGESAPMMGNPKVMNVETPAHLGQPPAVEHRDESIIRKLLIPNARSGIDKSNHYAMPA
jgi:hypothetical protein